MRTWILPIVIVVCSAEVALAQHTAVVTAASLRLRSRATSSSSNLGSYRRGTKVKVLSESGSWSRVQVGGRTGYMFTKYLKRVADASASSSSSTPSASGTARVNASGGLRIRTRPNGGLIGALDDETKVEVLGKRGSWTKVRADGKTGYVFSKYLADVAESSAPSSPPAGHASSAPPPSSSTSSHPASSAAAGYRVNAPRGLRMRSQPSTRGRTLGVLSHGSGVEVLDTSRRPWLKVRAGGKTGYVWSTYLTEGAGSSSGSVPASAHHSSGGSAGTVSGGSIDRRNLSGLRPGFRAKVERILRRMQSLGWRPYVAEGIRSRASQRRKVRLGYSKTMNSYHLYGLAADIVDRRYGWNLPQSHRYWRDLGRAAAAEGLTWGGSWRSFKDVAHVQARSRNAH